MNRDKEHHAVTDPALLDELIDKCDRPAMEDSLNIKLSEVIKIMQQRIVEHSRYFGVITQKNPLDFWIYQEIICKQKPDVILEIGNKHGGSTLAIAHLLDHIGKGRIVGVDINHAHLSDLAKAHPRITFIEGDAAEIADRVKEEIGSANNVMVIEDSSHTYENTLAVLSAYADLVPPGGYFIVEDSICHHGLDHGPNPGPYLITWNPKGYLRRLPISSS
jgi:cephalosporin hydroxylase